MGVINFQMRTHSREDITDKCKVMRDCVTHHCKPRILKIVAGKRKETYYVAICESDDCTKFTDNLEDTIDTWNIHNPAIKCTAKNCNEPAIGDYNGHGAFACEYHMKKWNDEFDDEYK